MADWRNRIIERRTMRIGDIRPNKWNPKGHPGVQQERLRAVLDKFGIVGDLIAFKDTDGEYTLFDGHARQTLDPDQEWPILFTDLSRQEIDELVLYFDPLAALARQEADKTAALMADLKVQERALREMLEEQAKSLGFAYGRNGGGAQEAPEPQLDRAAELQEKWQVETGDLWVIPSRTAQGEHRIVCGDCTDKAVVERVAGGARSDLGITDPPYGIDYEYESYEDIGGNQYLAFCDTWFELFRQCSELQIVTTGWAYKPYWYSKKPKGELVWFDKTKQSGHVIAHLRKSEPIFVFGNIKDKYKWDVFLNEGTRGDGLRELHTCPKPLSLFEDLIEPQTDRLSTIIDFFLGSGTTLVACERLGRLGRGVEIEPKYCAVSLQRLQDLGLDPRLVE